MTKLNNQKGFTLIELIMVITILSILSIAVMPTAIDIQDGAKMEMTKRVAAIVQDGININFSESIMNGTVGFIANADIDTNPIGACVRCFDGVLAQPINDEFWAKSDPNTWTYTNGSMVRVCNYDSVTGEFSCG